MNSVEYVKTLQEHMVRWFKGRGDTHFLQVRFLELKLFLTHDVSGWGSIPPEQEG